MEKTIILENESGLHARPASELVQITKDLDSDIKIIYDNKEVDGKSIFNIMALGIPSGAELTIKTIGGDEKNNLNTVIDFLKGLEG